MQSAAFTPEAYIIELPEERKAAMNALRKVIFTNLPKCFKEVTSYGMIGYLVPLSLYPVGYHCNPKLLLGLVNIASQKNYIALHHIGLYADDLLLNWLVNEYKKVAANKIDMGKGCIRFKKLHQIPYQLIGALAAKFTPQQWIKLYDEKIKNKFILTIR